MDNAKVAQKIASRVEIAEIHEKPQPVDDTALIEEVEAYREISPMQNALLNRYGNVCADCGGQLEKHLLRFYRSLPPEYHRIASAKFHLHLHCSQCRQPFFVNKPKLLFSTKGSARPDFVDQVLAALARTGANPHNLKLELTESMLVDNIEDVIAKAADLHFHGIEFSPDDCGIGYSSLCCLKRLPLEQLKIDRSFVRDIAENASSRAIAQSIISLGAAMCLSVIAEGVETEEQQHCLAQLGCRAFQGYLLSRPLPLEEFPSRE